MSSTDRSSQKTLVNPEVQIHHNYQQDPDFVCGLYLIKPKSSKTPKLSKDSDLECVVVPDKIPQAANPTDFRQTYKSHCFQFKGGRQNGKYLKLDVIKEAPGYILAAGIGHCWHMRTLFDLNDFDEKPLQKFVSFTEKNSHLIARYYLVKATIRTYGKSLLQHEQTYLGCATNTTIVSFTLLLMQMPISNHLIKYLIKQVRDS